jgi:hypothetical protein
MGTSQLPRTLGCASLAQQGSFRLYKGSSSRSANSRGTCTARQARESDERWRLSGAEVRGGGGGSRDDQAWFHCWPYRAHSLSPPHHHLYWKSHHPPPPPPPPPYHHHNHPCHPIPQRTSLGQNPSASRLFSMGRAVIEEEAVVHHHHHHHIIIITSSSSHHHHIIIITSSSASSSSTSSSSRS